MDDAEVSTFDPIGRVRTPHREQSGTPIQPVFGEANEVSRVEIDVPWRDGLDDLDGYERVWLLTHLQQSPGWRPRVVPYRDTVERGVFSTRSPCRPNPIGLSCVELRTVDVEAGVLTIGPCDLLDGTPVLDVKPYVPKADAFPEARAGWFGASKEPRDHADDRFV